MILVNGCNSVLNLGFEYDISDDLEKENFMCIIVKNQKKFVIFDELGFFNIFLMDEGIQKKLSFEDLFKDGKIFGESVQSYLV